LVGTLALWEDHFLHINSPAPATAYATDRVKRGSDWRPAAHSRCPAPHGNASPTRRAPPVPPSAAVTTPPPSAPLRTAALRQEPWSLSGPSPATSIHLV
ncbi:hypothetical protein U9M48_034989, partial [Paspalum notatum var. saurae]